MKNAKGKLGEEELAVYVDQVRQRAFVSASHPLRYSCHLMADTAAELEDFGRRLGLPKRWKHRDHYDLTRARRKKAVEAGAIEITDRKMVVLFRRVRGEG